MHKRCLGTETACRLQQVQRAHRVGIEIIERDLGRLVVAGLGGRMHDGIRPEFLHQRQHALAVAQVQFVMLKAADGRGESLLVPARVALRAEEHRSLVIVQAVNAPTAGGKVGTHFRADQAGGTGYQQSLHADLAIQSVCVSAKSVISPSICSIPITGFQPQVAVANEWSSTTQGRSYGRG